MHARRLARLLIRGSAGHTFARVAGIRLFCQESNIVETVTDS